MPRGAWPVRRLHDPFDRYKAIEGSDRWGTGLRVMSDYDDPFVVVLDERTGNESRLDPSVFASMVDECQTRVVVVRPVEDIMEVPWRYLEMLPRHSLQSLSVAVGQAGRGADQAVPRFRRRLRPPGRHRHPDRGQRGVPPDWPIPGTGCCPWISSAGGRPGYFTTIEFDSPFDEMMQTYRAHLSRLAKIPPCLEAPRASPAAPASRRCAPRPRSTEPISTCRTSRWPCVAMTIRSAPSSRAAATMDGAGSPDSHSSLRRHSLGGQPGHLPVQIRAGLLFERRPLRPESGCGSRAGA